MADKMPRTDSSQAMLALAAYGEVEEADDSVINDPDDEMVDDKISDDEEEIARREQGKRSASVTPTENFVEERRPPKIQRKATKLVSYDNEDMEKADEELSSDEDAVEDETSKVQIVDPSMSLSSEMATVLSRGVQNMAEGDIQLPTEPPGKCSRRLQEKITNFIDRIHKTGYDLNEDVQNKKFFRNPSIYEKLIVFCGIDEKGTNYPPEIYDPHMWGPESFYEELAKAQKVDTDKREKERKERTKIEFQTGTKKSSDPLGEKRKSKWDSQVGAARPNVVTTTAVNPPVVSVTTSITGSKTTVISAVGTISKKPSTNSTAK